MKTIKYTVDLAKAKAEDAEIKKFTSLQGQKDLFEKMTDQGLASKYSSGVRGKILRSYERILAALDETKTEFISIDDADMETLQDIFSDAEDGARFMPFQTRITRQYRDNVKNAVEGSVPELKS